MTASVGREVHRNRLSADALKGAVTCAEADDAGSENLGGLGEAFSGGEIIGRKDGHVRTVIGRSS